MQAHYLTVIYWSDEDDAFIGRVPALEGCVSHGATYEEAARNVAEAIDAWLESAERHGDPIPDVDAVADELRRLRPLLNLSKLAKEAGLNHHTLASKLRRGTKLTPAEAKSVGRVLATV